ncbi:ATP-binding cassette domain-containing protein [Planctomycetota bacterium]
MSVIDVNELSKTYRIFRKREGLTGSLKDLFSRQQEDKPAVREISFAIEEGEFVGFIGPNGAGKTTTLKMLSGILTPTSGAATVLGFRPLARKKEFLRQIGLVMGNKASLHWALPPQDSFLLSRDIYHIPEKEYRQRVESLSDMIGLNDLLNVQLRLLSLGERMKAELIASLLHSPKVLFLDEPTLGLDIVSQRAIRSFLATYNQEEKSTILLTSHYMEDIRRLCQRIIIINHGKILFDGSMKNLFESYGGMHRIDLSFEQAPSGEEIEYLHKIGDVHVDPVDIQKYSITLPKEEVRQATADCIRDLKITQILISEPQLEDIVSQITPGTQE